ncbi:MAG: hypothetical protein KDK70_34270, partial [Myxococcales bacterium]|nr:hypothetical protein [Myxococcales bacterium]
MAEPNPIERRLGWLRAQYGAFIADDQARLLHWVLAEDERRMMDAFLRVEAISGETGDLLLLLDTPFGDPARYGMELVAELCELYDALRESLSEAGLADTDWRPPPPRPAASRPAGLGGGAAPPDVDYLRQAAASFHAHHQPLLRHLSLVLQPARVADPAALTAWLGAAVQAFDDPALRLVLVDRAAYPS